VDEAGVEPKDIELVMTQVGGARPARRAQRVGRAAAPRGAAPTLPAMEGDIAPAIRSARPQLTRRRDTHPSKPLPKASVSRARAVKALKASGGDIVSAIMELTM
jgi:hypothetical protein